MLVLSRRYMERIVIGDDIVITVLGLRGDKIRIGIEAPDGVSVHREEVREDILAEQRRNGGSPHRLDPPRDRTASD